MSEPGDGGTASHEAARILLVDDHPMVLQGMARTLSRVAGFKVVGRTTDAAHGVKLARELRPDVVVMDVVFPSGSLDGASAARLIRQALPAAQVVAFSAHADTGCVLAMLAAGAVAYVLKASEPGALVAAVHAVLAGGRYFSSGLVGPLVRHVEALGCGPEEAARLALTEREREILRRLADGQEPKEMALELAVSPRSIEIHVRKLIDKLDAKNLAGLVKYAIRIGLVTA
jgi:DNA-binding NarL/FixJ family response regulator